MRLFQIILGCCIAGLSSMAFVPAYAQSGNPASSKEKRIQDWVNRKQYTFVAQRALPMRGGGRDLTSEYDLKVAGDTIIAFLPYFGRAYTAPVDPSKGGIKFTSTQFNYKSEPAKRGGWSVRITPEDNRDVQNLSLTISKDGYASLQVTSTNRQPISFHGYVKGNEPE